MAKQKTMINPDYPLLSLRKLLINVTVEFQNVKNMPSNVKQSLNTTISQLGDHIKKEIDRETPTQTEIS